MTFQIRDKHLYELLQNESCETFRYNYTIPPFFHFAALRIQDHTSLFRCKRSLHVSPPTGMLNYTKCPDYDLYYKHIITADDVSRSSLAACTEVQLPIKDVPDAINPFTFVTADIIIRVDLTDECADCNYRHGGQCKLDSTETFCCVNVVKKGLSLKTKLGIGNVLFT
ncbi:hypothetical protein JHK87_029283 [Glycine soja]|nr:hypothetical protein JHK87_029283 [Glycine soja]